MILAAVLLDRIFASRPFPSAGGFRRSGKAHRSNTLRRRKYGYCDAICTRHRRSVRAANPLIALAIFLQQLAFFGTLFSIVLLYFAIAPRSLSEHAVRVAEAFSAGDLPAARQAVSMMVSRDTRSLG